MTPPDNPRAMHAYDLATEVAKVHPNVTAVDSLRGRARGANAEQISRALYFCLKELGAEEQQAAQIESIRAARGIPAAEEAAREWNVVMQLLDELRLLNERSCPVTRRGVPSAMSMPSSRVEGARMRGRSLCPDRRSTRSGKR